MKLLLINSTNSAFRICKNECENCRPRQECSQFVGFHRASPLILNRTIVYCSMMYCCYFHFKYSFNYCFNCSLNHFWDKQQQPHIRMAKLHKSFTITVTLVVCFVHSFLERGFYVCFLCAHRRQPDRVASARQLKWRVSQADATRTCNTRRCS